MVGIRTELVAELVHPTILSGNGASTTVLLPIQLGIGISSMNSMLTLHITLFGDVGCVQMGPCEGIGAGPP
jgi:hypothetical protein